MAELICCQKKIPRQQWRYGFRASAETGCGWIAAYNALVLMGYPAEPEKIIRYFERQLPLIHGNLGTTILAPAFFFGRMGFRVDHISRRDRFDALASDADACILFYRWRKGLKIGAHFTALRHTDRGFEGYNTYLNSDGPDAYGESLNCFLKKNHYFGAVLIGIWDK